MQTPPLCIQESESRQAHMERIFRIVCTCVEPEAATRITEMLQPRFVSCDAEKRVLCLGYSVQEWMLNLNGAFHGGLASSMLDTTMGLLARYFAGESTVATLHLTTNFLKRIDRGTALVVKASLLKQGSRISFLSGEIYAIGNDDVLVSGDSSFMPLHSRPHLNEISGVDSSEINSNIHNTG